MTILTRAALPLAALLCIPTSALGAPATSAPPIVVTGSPRAAALADWSQRVGQNITSKMRIPYRLGRTHAPDGLVEVGFTTDDNGNPANVTVARKSGDSRTDAAAVRAISGMGTLHPLPEGMNRNQAFRAQLAFLEAGDERDLKRRLAALQETARRGNSWYTSQDQVASGTVLLIAASR
jgi:TonB family protein